MDLAQAFRTQMRVEITAEQRELLLVSHVYNIKSRLYIRFYGRWWELGSYVDQENKIHHVIYRNSVPGALLNDPEANWCTWQTAIDYTRNLMQRDAEDIPDVQGVPNDFKMFIHGKEQEKEASQKAFFGGE